MSGFEDVKLDSVGRTFPPKQRTLLRPSPTWKMPRLSNSPQFSSVCGDGQPRVCSTVQNTSVFLQIVLSGGIKRLKSCNFVGPVKKHVKTSQLQQHHTTARHVKDRTQGPTTLPDTLERHRVNQDTREPVFFNSQSTINVALECSNRSCSQNSTSPSAAPQNAQTRTSKSSNK